MRQHSLPSTCYSASESDTPWKRRLEGGRKCAASEATPAAADGDGAVQEKSVAGEAECKERV